MPISTAKLQTAFYEMSELLKSNIENINDNLEKIIDAICTFNNAYNQASSVQRKEINKRFSEFNNLSSADIQMGLIATFSTRDLKNYLVQELETKDFEPELVMNSIKIRFNLLAEVKNGFKKNKTMRTKVIEHVKTINKNYTDLESKLKSKLFKQTLKRLFNKCHVDVKAYLMDNLCHEIKSDLGFLGKKKSKRAKRNTSQSQTSNIVTVVSPKAVQRNVKTIGTLSFAQIASRQRNIQSDESQNRISDSNPTGSLKSTRKTNEMVTLHTSSVTNSHNMKSGSSGTHYSVKSKSNISPQQNDRISSGPIGSSFQEVYDSSVNRKISDRKSQRKQPTTSFDQGFDPVKVLKIGILKKKLDQYIGSMKNRVGNQILVCRIESKSY